MAETGTTMIVDHMAEMAIVTATGTRIAIPVEVRSFINFKSG